VAGGATLDATGGSETSRTARFYDPVSNTWSRLPSMPEGRQGGLTVALADGSAMLIGGNDVSTEAAEGPAAPVTAVQFVPSP
jgi:N-acetylneuraminic acid mutarotase